MKMFSTISAGNLKYFDNYGNGIITYGAGESSNDRYATLANGPKEDLPNEFTICSAVYVKYRTWPGYKL